MDFEGFYSKTLKFLSYRSRSEKEVRDKLIKIKTPEYLINEIIKKLKDYKFLDDLEFAKMFARERSLLKHKPARVIKFELKQKGIAQEVIEEVLTDSKEEEKDLEKAKEIIQKKLSRYKDLDNFKTREKLGRFLASRGFDYDTIKIAIDEILTERV
ncbi:MAG TPA: regulatory protein RecX [Patescibacteria group bacterium]|nr:regulatory protein RecX [Patescibacteria group bacterium]